MSVLATIFGLKKRLSPSHSSFSLKAKLGKQALSTGPIPVPGLEQTLSPLCRTSLQHQSLESETEGLGEFLQGLQLTLCGVHLTSAQPGPVTVDGMWTLVQRWALGSIGAKDIV